MIYQLPSVSPLPSIFGLLILGAMLYVLYDIFRDEIRAAGAVRRAAGIAVVILIVICTVRLRADTPFLPIGCDEAQLRQVYGDEWETWWWLNGCFLPWKD